MTNIPIISRLNPLKQAFARGWQALTRHHRRGPRPNLHQLAQHPDLLPRFVRQSPVAIRYLRLLGPLHWGRFPQCDLETGWGTPAVPYATLAAACLVKLDQQLVYMSPLCQYLAAPPPRPSCGFWAFLSFLLSPTPGASMSRLVCPHRGTSPGCCAGSPTPS